MMQAPPHLMLLPRRAERVHTEASKYVRNEFGDSSPSWLIAMSSDDGRQKDICEPRKSCDAKAVPAELAVAIPMRDGRGADQ